MLKIVKIHDPTILPLKGIQLVLESGRKMALESN